MPKWVKLELVEPTFQPDLLKTSEVALTNSSSTADRLCLSPFTKDIRAEEHIE